MNFYFCEACGKRLTEIDIGAGKAKDKKLKGVYCTECSAGVMTMDNLPLTQEQARKILANEPPAGPAGAADTRRAKPAAAEASGVRPATSVSARSVASRRGGDVNSGVYIAVGVVVLALVGGAVMLSGEGRPPGKPIASNPKPPEPIPVAPIAKAPAKRVEPAAKPEPDVRHVAPVAPKPKPGEPEVKPEPEVRPAAPVAPDPNPVEDAAAKAFAQLGKSFDALPPGDMAERVTLGEAFLKEHGESLEASRVRVTLDGWKKESAAKSAPPAETKPVGVKPAPPGETKPVGVKPVPARKQAELVGWYKLDDGKGLVAADSSPGGNHGKIVDKPQWMTGDGGGMHFTNDSNYVVIPNSAVLDSLQENDYSVTAWFKPDSNPPEETDHRCCGYAVIAKEGKHAGLEYYHGGYFSMDHWLVNSRVAAVGGPYPPNVFYHLAGVVSRTEGETRIYVNGIMAGSKKWKPGAATMDYKKATWKIGIAIPAKVEWSWPAKGIVRDVRFYKGVLTDAEVAALSVKK